MTDQKKLKSAIRSRARRTGESYTAARAQVLKKRATAAKQETATSTQTSKAASKKKSAVGSVSDEAVQKKTGKSLAHWFKVLDRFGAPEKGHTAAARHLREDHDVGAWYSQGITVAYERERGLRVTNQTGDGKFAFSVSRTLAADLDSVLHAVRDAAERKKWTRGVDAGAAKLFAKTASQRREGAWVVEDERARVRYRNDSGVVEFRFTAKDSGKTALAIAHSKLDSTKTVDAMRPHWKALLDHLRDHLS